MRSPKIVGNVVKEWKERGPGEKTFMFCVDRAHAQIQMQAFTDSGVPFGYIDANTPMEDRKRQFQRMGCGDLAGIASVGCLIRGVDEDVRCIVDCQPTKSVMRHVQKWGRGIRMADGKSHLIGLDHVDNNRYLGLFSDIHFETLDKSKPGEPSEAQAKEPAKPKLCPNCKALMRPGERQCGACGAMCFFTSVETVAGELVEFGTKAQKRVNREATLSEKQEFYSGLLTLAQRRGKSEGAAAHRYREKYGVWPNALKKEPGPVSLEVENWDRHCRIRYAKSKAKEQAVAS
jgi:superfamily II DNA or RNA helicase